MTDDELRDLLTDAVSDVEPTYRLGEIRARTHRPARRGWYAVGGAILAAAAVVTAVSVVNDDGPRRTPPVTSDNEQAVALYFVGDTPDGPRLYREFQRISGTDPLASLEAMTAARGPEDPDYRTLWPAGIFESVAVVDDAIKIELGQFPRNRPGYTASTWRLAAQQVVHTAQAATGMDLPVRFIDHGSLIIPLAGGLERAPQNEVLSLVSISDPAEGLHVKGSFVARGRANSFEGNVLWRIRDGAGSTLEQGVATASGSGDRLYPWETNPIDVSGLEPGTYEFVVYRDGNLGDEGPPYTDTRTIIVE